MSKTSWPGVDGPGLPRHGYGTVIEPGGHDACPVCEFDVARHAVRRREGEIAVTANEGSARPWLFVACSQELLTICLHCGNTEREKRIE